MKSKLDSNRSKNDLDYKLKIAMKSSITRKSPVALLKTTRKGNILAQMTSTVNKKSKDNQYQISLLNNSKIISIPESDISGIKPLDNCESENGEVNQTTNISISQCRKSKTDRGKVKTPLNNNKIKKKAPSDNLEADLRKKNGEILTLNRKINKLEEILTEKNKIIKDLEIKFPKMLSELSRGLGKDPDKLKVSLELKETIKRNRQLNGSQKRNEELIKVKDDKIKHSQWEKEKLQDDLKLKERECRDLKCRLSSLETKIPHLLNKIDAREVEIKHLKSENEELNYRLRWINEENFTKTREIDKLSAEIVENQLNLQDKQQTLDSLELKLEQTQRHLNSEGEKINDLELKLKDLVKIVDQCQCESKQHESALEVGNDGIFSDQNSDEEVSYDQEVFTDQCQNDDNLIVVDDDEDYDYDGSCVSESDYDVSAGTIAKAEELDVKVRELWNRLSNKDETFDLLHTNHHMLDMSMKKLKQDINQSFLRNNTLHSNVNIAKKLFM